MAHRFLYEHGSFHQGGGYQIVATSATGEVYREVVSELQRCIRDLAFEVRLIPAHGGAMWLALSNGRRVYGKVLVNSDAAGERYLSIRMVVLNSQSAANFLADPLRLDSLVSDGSDWQPGEGGTLAEGELPDPGATPASTVGAADVLRRFSLLQWELFRDRAADVLRRGLPALNAGEQATFWFAYPLSRPSRACGSNRAADGVQWVIGEGLSRTSAGLRLRNRVSHQRLTIAATLLILTFAGGAYFGGYWSDRAWQAELTAASDEWQRQELQLVELLNRANIKTEALRGWRDTLHATLESLAGQPLDSVAEVAGWIEDTAATSARLQVEVGQMGDQLQQWRDVAGRQTPDELVARLRELERDADEQLKAETRALEQQIAAYREQKRATVLKIETIRARLASYLDQLDALHKELASEREAPVN